MTPVRFVILFIILVGASLVAVSPPTSEILPNETPDSPQNPPPQETSPTPPLPPPPHQTHEEKCQANPLDAECGFCDIEDCTPKDFHHEEPLFTPPECGSKAAETFGCTPDGLHGTCGTSGYCVLDGVRSNSFSCIGTSSLSVDPEGPGGFCIGKSDCRLGHICLNFRCTRYCNVGQPARQALHVCHYYSPLNVGLEFQVCQPIIHSSCEPTDKCSVASDGGGFVCIPDLDKWPGGTGDYNAQDWPLRGSTPMFDYCETSDECQAFSTCVNLPHNDAKTCPPKNCLPYCDTTMPSIGQCPQNLICVPLIMDQETGVCWPG